MNRNLAGAAALVLSGLGALVAWRLLALVRDRYRHLLAAVEALARQATELRTEVDRVRGRVERIDDRLAASVVPELARLGRALAIDRAAARVAQAEQDGGLAPETARRLQSHLADLGEAILAREPPPAESPPAPGAAG